MNRNIWCGSKRQHRIHKYGGLQSLCLNISSSSLLLKNKRPKRGWGMVHAVTLYLKLCTQLGQAKAAIDMSSSLYVHAHTHITPLDGSILEVRIIVTPLAYYWLCNGLKPRWNEGKYDSHLNRRKQTIRNKNNITNARRALRIAGGNALESKHCRQNRAHAQMYTHAQTQRNILCKQLIHTQNVAHCKQPLPWYWGDVISHNVTLPDQQSNLVSECLRNKFDFPTSETYLSSFPLEYIRVRAKSLLGQHENSLRFLL